MLKNILYISTLAEKNILNIIIQPSTILTADLSAKRVELIQSNLDDLTLDFLLVLQLFGGTASAVTASFAEAVTAAEALTAAIGEEA